MKSTAAFALLFFALAPLALAQTPSLTTETGLGGVDGSALATQLQEREGKIQKLPSEEQKRLRIAQQRALDDPAVKEALRIRDEAMSEFQAAFLAGMLKSDPEIASILEKLKMGVGKGY